MPEEIQCWKGSVFSIFSRGVANWDGSWLRRPPADSLGESHSQYVAHIVKSHEVTKC